MILKTQRKHYKPRRQTQLRFFSHSPFVIGWASSSTALWLYTRLGLCAIICCHGPWARAHTALTLITEQESSAHVASWPMQSMNNVADE